MPKTVRLRPIERVRYPALSRIAGVYRFLAVIWGLAGAVWVIVGLSKAADSPWEGWVIVVGALLIGILSVVTYLAIAEGVQLGIDIEKNTRSTVDLLREIAAKNHGTEEVAGGS